MSSKVEDVLNKKVLQSQICFEALKDIVDIDDSIPVTFCVNTKRKSQLMRACTKNNPFPKYRIILCIMRMRGVKKLFKDEKVLQTPPTAAALAACGSIAYEIGKLRGNTDEQKVYCDIGFAGLQAIRLYMGTSLDDKFSKRRFFSCINVNNALNGSMNKYKTKDNRYFSFHVYYESQKAKLVEALKMPKKSTDLTMDSLKKDKVLVRDTVSKYDGLDLEELSFNCGASACVVRSREEWENTEVGKAVCKMPLIRSTKTGDAAPKKYGKPNEKGPLSGIKVLDLTHIIAGPACTRILAEYGADVLMVRRGEYNDQEQAFLELDGWAGKHSIQLDLNEPKALKKIKQLIKEADVIVYSYQQNAFDKFGLSADEIKALNPNLIFGTLMCFSDTVWKDRPGWAPLAEDMSGLSVRNGSMEKPKNLNGVPLDYVPGTVLALGILNAIKKTIKEGGSYTVTTSLTRAAQWLHDCTDLCENPKVQKFTTLVEAEHDFKNWDCVLQMVENNAVGTIGFPSPAIVNPALEDTIQNMNFTDGNTDWHQK